MIHQALTQASDCIHAMVDSLPANIYFKNRDGIYTDINATALTTMLTKGYISTPDKMHILGKSDFDLFNTDVAESFRANDIHVLKSRYEYCLEEENITPNGEIIKHISMKKPVYNGDNHPIGIFGITFIINNIKKLQHNRAIKYDVLTIRENECLNLYRKGLTSKETALMLGLSHRTVEEHFDNIKRKLNCQHKRDLLLFNISNKYTN